MAEFEDQLLRVLRSKDAATIRELAEDFPQVHINTVRNALRRLTEQHLVLVHRLGRELQYEAVVPTERPETEIGRPVEQSSTPPIEERDRRKDELAADVDPI